MFGGSQPSMPDDAAMPVWVVGLMYAFFSSTMMIFNKGALGVFPFPLQLTSLQYFVSAAAVFVPTNRIPPPQC